MKLFSLDAVISRNQQRNYMPVNNSAVMGSALHSLFQDIFGFAKGILFIVNGGQFQAGKRVIRKIVQHLY